MNVKKSVLIAVLLSACLITSNAMAAKKPVPTIPVNCDVIESPFPVPVPKSGPISAPWPGGNWVKALLRSLGISSQTAPNC